MTKNTILEEQIDYYKNRAQEYDEWFYREGRYFLGEKHKIQWFSEVKIIESALIDSKPHGNILELACGTGIWTEKLLPHADKITAVDASEETINVCKSKLPETKIEFLNCDIFNWKPKIKYDYIFFGHWLSHVPKNQFNSFWSTVKSALNPNGQVFFVDSLFSQNSTGIGNKPIDKSGFVERKLNNGKWYRIVKEFYEPDELFKVLKAMGWTGYIRGSGEFFIFGCLSIDS